MAYGGSDHLPVDGSSLFGRIARCGLISIATGRTLLLLGFVFAAGTSTHAWAADSATDDESTKPDEAADVRPIDTVCQWGLLPGEPARNSIYLGMWSYHLWGDSDYRTDNQLIGGVYRGCYAGTFINSHDDRTTSIGWQRDFYTRTREDLRLDVGYRFGIMHGYDEFSIGNSKLFPLLQFYADVAYKQVGVQFTWVGQAVTAGFLIRFP